MIVYRLIHENEKEYLYEYIPEENMRSGIVSFSKKTGEIKVIKISEDDDSRHYIGMLFSKLREFRRNNNFKTNGVVAWY